ncbi:MAG: hypothetical protein AAF404_04885 [Pseudomonadota bacterium]
MKALLPLITAATILGSNALQASEIFIGAWASGTKEVLQITEKGGDLSAEFVRENVKSEFERIRFPAKYQDGALIITGEQGDLSARYDSGNKLLILGGMKSFQKLSSEQAQQLINQLEKK